MSAGERIMKYYMAIQFPLADHDKERFDAIIAFEAELEDWLSPDCEVDGHDAGSGEMNVFIRTDRPQVAFEHAKLLIDSALGIREYRAGYRSTSGGPYTPLWPPGLESFDIT